ncbi:MAG: SMC family ATPase, partial [Dehalococcoidales bacterium]|nr:SMC family ATPase [Dehalococcoidales bacterium]
MQERSRRQERLGGIRSRLEQINQLEVKMKEKQEELRRVGYEARIYGKLGEAFGKNGIQALIIEMALPEIENEANALLALMTDNRMHVKFSTQR